MILFARESLAVCWHEIYDPPDGLAYLHWCETQGRRHNQGYNPLFERYRQYERMGMFEQFTARDDGKLVGYSGVYVVPSMHSQKLIAVEDTWYLHPEYRKGWNAVHFYKWIERYLTPMGVWESTLTLPTSKDPRMGHLLERLDYQPVAVQYSRVIARPDRAMDGFSVEDTNDVRTQPACPA